MHLKHVLLASAALLAFAACAPKQQDKADDTIVAAYLSSWSQGLPSPFVQTHIIYAFGHVNDDFRTMRIGEEPRFQSVLALREQNPKLKIMISIGGWGSGNFSEMAADENLRKAYCADVKRVVDKYRLDGIDLDWEYPTSSAAGISSSPEDTENYVLLFRDMRAALGDDVLLTVASACDADNGVDIPNIVQYVDFVNIMAYDMDGNQPAHNAALYRSDIPCVRSCEEAVRDHLNRGVPKEKIVLGMPFFGHGKFGFRYPVRDYTKVELDLPEGYTQMWDEVARVPYVIDSEGRLVYTYDDVRSIKEKCDFIKERGLRGGMYWEFSNDDPQRTLANLVHDELLGN